MIHVEDTMSTMVYQKDIMSTSEEYHEYTLGDNQYIRVMS